MDVFAARLDRHRGQVTVFLQGELDLATAPILERVLDGLTGPIRFDCADLTFLDSSGLAIVSRQEHSGGATMCNVTAHVRRVLEVAGMDGLIDES